MSIPGINRIKTCNQEVSGRENQILSKDGLLNQGSNTLKTDN